MRFRRILSAVCGAALCAAATPLAGQTPTPAVPAPTTRPGTPDAVATGMPVGPDSAGPVLTLAEAQNLAQRNNPTFLQTIAARRSAGAASRAAWGQLLPQANAQLIGGYQQAGQVFFSGSALGSSSDAVESQWSLGLTYQLSAATLLTPAVARANQRAADADVRGASSTLTGNVAMQYVTVLEDQARAALQDTLVVDALAQANLARARVTVGSATPLDQRRAEVALGTQQVQALQAHNQVDIDKLRLFQQLGVVQPRGVRLIDAYVVAPPGFTADSVLAIARRDNPQVNALRAREHAASVSVHRAAGLYTPTFNISTGVGGYTYEYTDQNFLVNQAQLELQAENGPCLSLDSLAQSLHAASRTCGPTTLTPAQAAQIRSGNRQFPFSFTNTPRQITATFSLPIFDGFQRERTVEQAEVDHDDARYNQRAGELQLTADVTSAYLTLTTSVRTVQIQEQNSAAARDALYLAEERYKVGAATFVDVTDARAAYERAENDRIGAVYDYHKAFAALENAVGRPLR
jgi:outer membrane protein